MKRQTKAYLFALSAVFFWSTVATAFKLALRFYTPLQLIFLSAFVSFIIFALFLVFSGKINMVLRQAPKDLLMSAFMGFLSPTAYYLVLFKAYSLLPAQIAQPLNYTWTIVLVLLSVPMLKQKLTLRQFIGIIIGFSGAYVISTQGNLFSFRIDNPTGVALAVISSVFWALFWIFNVRDHRDETVKLFTNFFFGIIYLAAIMFVSGDWNFPKDWRLLGPVYIGLFEMGLTFFLWMKAMQLTVSSAKISNLVFLSPFLSLVFIHFILGEKLYFTTFLGLVLIVGGILLEKTGGKR